MDTHRNNKATREWRLLSILSSIMIFFLLRGQSPSLSAVGLNYLTEAGGKEPGRESLGVGSDSKAFGLPILFRLVKNSDTFS